MLLLRVLVEDASRTHNQYCNKRRTATYRDAATTRLHVNADCYGAILTVIASVLYTSSTTDY